MDHRAELGLDEQRHFDALHTWRNERGHRHAKQAYLLFTTRQLAELVRLPPIALAALDATDGLGEARTRAFGPDLVALIATRPGPPLPAPPPAPEAARAGPGRRAASHPRSRASSRCGACWSGNCWTAPGSSPRTVRFTLAQCIDGLALDVLESVVEARFARGTARPARAAP